MNSATKKTANAKQSQLQPITADAVYPLSVFQERTGLKRVALNEIRHESQKMGIPVIVEQSRRLFVVGRNYIEYLHRRGTEASSIEQAN